MAFGYDFNGALGNGTTQPSTTPLLVEGLSSVTSVSASNHSLAAAWQYLNNLYYGWGQNDSGQVGINSTTPVLSPQVVNWPYSESNHDGLPDWWKLKYFGTLNVDPNADPSGDGLTNLEQYLYANDPIDPDTSRDGIPDKVKLQNGLNIFTDDAFDDQDGDRYPNIFEYSHGTGISDSSSTPAPDYVVGPNETYQTISSALTAWATTFEHVTDPIVLVRDGTYNESVTVPSGDNILIISEHGPLRTTINGVLNVSGNAVVDGFTITSQAGTSSPVIVVSDSGYPTRTPCINHCIISGVRCHQLVTVTGAKGLKMHSCLVTKNVIVPSVIGISAVGELLSCSGSTLEISGSTITGNYQSPRGYDLVGMSTINCANSTINIHGSILYNPAIEGGEFAFSDLDGNTINVTDSFVRQGHVASQGSGVTMINVCNLDPQISFDGYPLQTSPTLTWPAANLVDSNFEDVFLNQRQPGQNLGAVGYVDSDANGLNDEWEIAYYGTLGQDLNADPIQDGLTNLQKYNYGSNPLKADTDGDGLTNGQKKAFGCDPWIADNAGDGLGNFVKAKYGLSPDRDDRFEDADYDHAPNVFEVINGTDPHNGASKPAPDIIVDATGATPASYTSISAGLSALTSVAKSYVIILVKPGTYRENVSVIDNTYSGKTVLLYAEGGPYNTFIQPPSGTAFSIGSPCVIDGFSVLAPVSTTSSLDYGVQANVIDGDRPCVLKNCIFQSLTFNVSPLSINVRLAWVMENVIMSNCNSASCCSITAPDTVIRYCTFYKNVNAFNGQALGAAPNLYINGNLLLQKSIVYDPGFEEVVSGDLWSYSGTSPYNVKFEDSLFPSNAPDPQLSAGGQITRYSSARNLDNAPVGRDVKDNWRAGDIGANQWIAGGPGDSQPPPTPGTDPQNASSSGTGILDSVLVSIGLNPSTFTGFPPESGSGPPPKTGSTNPPQIVLLIPIEATPSN